ncbi:hypothetical protein SADUNF_Sadunf16G0071100 [Salix dunnii]|uniref:Uncharacterized protein n=1 Tax=Salix dunnii TaxID=1413687 RepID=A0A835JAB0_9ROSI|nr:hypothetical protein SADUNF_Sadunf16G0071100 [Salix dunnii]
MLNMEKHNINDYAQLSTIFNSYISKGRLSRLEEMVMILNSLLEFLVLISLLIILMCPQCGYGLNCDGETRKVSKIRSNPFVSSSLKDLYPSHNSGLVDPNTNPGAREIFSHWCSFQHNLSVNIRILRLDCHYSNPSLCSKELWP